MLPLTTPELRPPAPPWVPPSIQQLALPGPGPGPARIAQALSLSVFWVQPGRTYGGKEAEEKEWTPSVVSALCLPAAVAGDLWEAGWRRVCFSPKRFPLVDKGVRVLGQPTENYLAHSGLTLLIGVCLLNNTSVIL